MSLRRVLVTGAGGFVGSALVHGFANAGWDVIALDREWDTPPTSDRIRCVRSSMADDLASEIPAVDVVIHGAWITSDPAMLGLTHDGYHQLNLEPLRVVLRYVEDTSPTAFVFLSSSGVFGASDAPDGLTETHTATGTSPYARAKRAGETLTETGVAPLETAAHVIRLGYLFGPREVARPSRPGVSLVARWLADAASGRALDVRVDDPLRDWTFAPDLGAAIERMVSAPAAGHPVHLGSPHVMHDTEWTSAIAAEFPDVEVRRVPADGDVKAPMVPTGIPALRDFSWTDPHAGLRRILGEGRAA